jgi:tetratricopeptide (TPR) repeat protein
MVIFTFFGKRSDQKKLQSILQELSQPGRPGDIPRRIQLCRQAIAFAPRERNPELWAALHVELGNNLAQNPTRDRAENIELAIEHYNEALKVYTQRDFPVQWAMTQNNLANAYNNRIRGDRAENIELAIETRRSRCTRKGTSPCSGQ